MSSILSDPPASEREAAERHAEQIRHWYRALGRRVTVEVELISTPRGHGTATTYSAVIKTPVRAGGGP